MHMMYFINHFLLDGVQNTRTIMDAHVACERSKVNIDRKKVSEI